jgi:hypothetical protein
LHLKLAQGNSRIKAFPRQTAGQLTEELLWVDLDEILQGSEV